MLKCYNLKHTNYNLSGCVCVCCVDVSANVGFILLKRVCVFLNICLFLIPFVFSVFIIGQIVFSIKMLTMFSVLVVVVVVVFSTI